MRSLQPPAVPRARADLPGRSRMKIASILARYLVGLIFKGFGMNGFLNFIPQPPANPLPIQFLVSVGESDFPHSSWRFTFSVGCGGLLLLSGYCGPLTLTVLAASSTISLAFHLTLAPASITPARRYYFSQHEEYNPGAEHCLVIGPYGHIGAQY